MDTDNSLIYLCCVEYKAYANNEFMFKLFKHHILEITTTEDKNVYLTLQNVDPITLKHISESERKLLFHYTLYYNHLRIPSTHTHKHEPILQNTTKRSMPNRILSTARKPF